MACLKHLPAQEIGASLEIAADEAMPVVVSARDSRKDSWVPCSSRLLGLGGDGMILEMPRPYGSETPREFVPGEEVCLTFRLNGDKLICRSIVVRSGSEMIDGVEVPALRAARPESAHLIQRRAFSRVPVPEGEMLRAGFSVGSSDIAAPPSAPVWTGRVIDLGAGGFRAAVDPGAAHELDDGTPVYACLAFGKAGRTVYSDAAVRHVDGREKTAIVGLEFLHLAETPEGQKTLHFLCERIQSYQQARVPLPEDVPAAE
jgi:c-di-GMP-binding flagellar brake protein YcgR